MTIRVKILVICGAILAAASVTVYVFYDAALNRAAGEDQLARARAYFQQIVLTRSWIAEYGGVYVIKGPGVETNPYLLKIPDLAVDIQDTEGNIYTLRNPALVTRELSELAEAQGIYKFHITSLKLVDPDNAPDTFEQRALEGFEGGVDEVWQLYELDGRQTFRYMAPLFIEQACLRCHESQGYELGDVRGGISVSVPVAENSGVRKTLILGWLVASLFTLGVLYLLLNFVIVRPLRALNIAAETIRSGDYGQPVASNSRDEIGKLAATFDQMRERVRSYTYNLEETVKQRTLELQEHSEHLEELVAARTKDLQAAQERLHNQEKLAVLGRLSGGVGHELRGPLGVITNAVYLMHLTVDKKDKKTREYLEMIAAESRTAERIINDLLNFARLPEPVLKPVNVSQWVARIFEKHPAPEGIEISTDMPDSLPPISADIYHLNMALGNLVTNAYQAMPGGGKLTVSARQLAVSGEPLAGRAAETEKSGPAAGDYLRISIQDTGTGIAPENLNKLFEPLFTTRPSGIGLGLVTTRMLLEANGGSIEVESAGRPGEGTTVTLMIPIFQ